MPLEVSATPAPLTFTIRPRLGWQSGVSILWFLAIGFALYQDLLAGYLLAKIFLLFGLVWFLSLFRRERIEIYPEQMVWKKTTLGITTSKRVPLQDVRGAEWKEGGDGERKAPSYIAFYIPDGIVKAGYTLSFEEFDLFREQIRGMYPQLYDRWSAARVQSDGLTLLNLN